MGEGDTGPNTGGMGAYTPAPVVTPALQEQILKDIITPTVEGMKAEGVPFTGVLFAGLMIRDGHPRLLEYNVRFGDPECQVCCHRHAPVLSTALMHSRASGNLDLKLITFYTLCSAKAPQASLPVAQARSCSRSCQGRHDDTPIL